MSGHMANWKTCPTLKATCNGCGKKDHFIACCKSQETVKRNKSQKVSEVCEEIVLQMRTAHVLNPKDVIKIDDVEAMFDSCSRFTMISESLKKNLGTVSH